MCRTSNFTDQVLVTGCNFLWQVTRNNYAITLRIPSAGALTGQWVIRRQTDVFYQVPIWCVTALLDCTCVRLVHGPVMPPRRRDRGTVGDHPHSNRNGRVMLAQYIERITLGRGPWPVGRCVVSRIAGWLHGRHSGPVLARCLLEEYERHPDLYARTGPTRDGTAAR